MLLCISTDEVIEHIVGIVDGTLEEVLVEVADVVVSLNLTCHVMAVESEGANVLVHLLHRLERLHHLSSFVQHVLLHRHLLPQQDMMPSPD